MSRVGPKALFFLGLPDLNQLVCVTLSLQEEDHQEPRTSQMKTCRELVLLFADVLACPALDSITDITAVVAIRFLQRGFLQAFAVRNRLQVGRPQRALPGDVQRCLSYALIGRLAPRWNKAGLYLIAGGDFLTQRGALSAVGLELSASEGRLCISMEANAVRTPPPTVGGPDGGVGSLGGHLDQNLCLCLSQLEDFGLPAPVLRRFCSDPDFILDPSSAGGPIWCHVLPSMKKGQILSIGRQLPRDGPFRTYRDLQNHWNRLYGYRLPDLEEQEAVYCSVYFRPVGEKLFTYPLSCIRLQPAQRCPRGPLQGALACFLSDITEPLQSVCGFPARLTSKPSYPAVGLSTAASVQVLSSDQINLTTSTPIRPVLSQPPPSSRPEQPAWIPLSQQGGAHPGNRSGNSLRRQEHWSSSSSSSSSQSQHSRLASSFYQHFQPASSLPPHRQPSPVPVNPTPKLVPIFRNNDPSRHINVALLRAQKQQSVRREETRRITLPVPVGSQPTAAASSSSFSAVSILPRPPPLIVPRFTHRPKTRSGVIPQLSGLPRVNRISSLSPVSRVKPAFIIPSRIKPKAKSSRTSEEVGPEDTAVSELWKVPGPESIVPKSIMKTSRDAGPESNTGSEPTQPLMAEGISNKETSISRKKKVAFELKEEKPRKSKASVEDVEKMARSNQWARLSSASLLLWLRQRGVQLGSKHSKDELMLKVRSCLAEA
ncbi:uncharacterized protein C18orf63 homolog isoform 2-T5 [Anableps anableps]